MNLVVVSHTPHYLRNGEIVGWGPTVREIGHLAELFDEVMHVAPVHDGDAPASALPYGPRNVSVVALRAAGGTRWRDKLRLLRSAPAYVRAIRRATRRADVLHIRCPSYVSLVAVVLATLRRRETLPRVWVKYAGDWHPSGSDPWSFRLQRWWASRAKQFVVTINGAWPDQPTHVRTMLNPCLTEAELADGRNAAAAKSLAGTIQLLFVGALVEAKGAMSAVAVLKGLTANGISAHLDLVGDGPLRARVERAAADGLPMNLHGWTPRDELSRFYGRAHIILLPSLGEGWPKVLSEAMAYGVVPVASTVGSIEQTLNHFNVGIAISGTDPSSYEKAVECYANDPSRWQRESTRAVAAAAQFSYDAYLDAVRAFVLSAPRVLR